MNARSEPQWHERQLEIETPEHVALGYELAGAGSRFAAFLLDAIFIGLWLIAALGISVFLLARVVPQLSLPWIAAVVVAILFITIWGYFILYEGLRDGQTPGKRRFGLRVVHEGGYPVTLAGAAIRNVLRVIVDAQPFPTWILGGTMIVLHPRAQRLGDLAAGTIVVRERTAGALPEERQVSGPPRLRDEEYEVLREYALRRDTLERRTRERLARKLAPHFRDVLSADGGGRAASSAAEMDGREADALLLVVYAEESGRRTVAGVATGSGSPAAAALLRRQRATWAEYRELVARARARGLSRLPEHEVSRFAALYREVAADLARARTYGASPELLYTLERAVAAGHNVLYARSPRSMGAVWKWLSAGFPRLVRRRKRAVLLAALLLFGPGLISFSAIALEPSRARLILEPEMIARAEEGAARARAGVGYAEVPEMAMPVFSTSIIANNVQVSFVAFAGGIAAGAGTVLALLLNGIFLGGVLGLFRAEGLDLYVWSFILPHGVLELTAICIAGAAGLWLGSAIVLPGRRPRKQVLVERGREAVSLLGGTVVMLVIAGIIEGFISPSRLPIPAKLAFAGVTAVLLAQYLVFAGRGREGAEGAPADPAGDRNVEP